MVIEAENNAGNAEITDWEKEIAADLGEDNDL